MMMLWLTVATVLAGDVQPLPTGTVIQEPEVVAPMILEGKSWLLSDGAFREAVSQAKELELVRPALEHCTDTAISLTEKVRTVAEKCLTQFDGDTERIDGLVKNLSVMEMRALTAESKLKDVRMQRTIAWSILGGVVAGGVVVLAVTYAP